MFSVSLVIIIIIIIIVIICYKNKNKITSPSSSIHRSIGMVLTTQNSSRGPVSPWRLKHKGRQGVQGHVRSSRLENRPFSICKVKSVVGAPRGGPVRISSVHPASSLLQLETRPSGRSCGCFLPRLELVKGVRIPPFCTHRQVPQNDSRSAGFLFSSSGTCMASSALVPLTPRDVCCSSSSPSSVSRLGNSSEGSTPPLKPAVSRVATIKQSYSEKGISEGAQNLLVAAWRKGTSSAYSSAWGKWDGWCREREINSVHAPIEAILEFLLNAGKAYRTLNVYRSAISSIHPSISGLVIERGL